MQVLPIFGESGSEASYFIPEPKLFRSDQIFRKNQATLTKINF